MSRYYSLLKKQGIACVLSERARIIDAEADYADFLKDENGNLLKSRLDKTWKSALSLFNKGKIEESLNLFRKRLFLTLKSKNPQELDDLLFELEKLLKFEKKFALACLELISEIDIMADDILEVYDDLLNHSIAWAQEILKQYK